MKLASCLRLSASIVPQKASRRRPASRSLCLSFALTTSPLLHLGLSECFARPSWVHDSCADPLSLVLTHPLRLTIFCNRPYSDRTFQQDCSCPWVHHNCHCALDCIPLHHVNSRRFCHGCTATAARPRPESANIPNPGALDISFLGRTYSSNVKYVRSPGRDVPKRSKCAEDAHGRKAIPQNVSGSHCHPNTTGLHPSDMLKDP